MKALNLFSCIDATINTGDGCCGWEPGLIEGAILAPKGTSFTPTQIQTLYTALTAGIENDNSALRLLPIKRFTDFEDKSTEAQTESLGYGSTLKVRDGKYWFRYRLGISRCLYNRLRGLDNRAKSFEVFLIDAQQNVLVGRKLANGNFAGLEMDMLSVPLAKWKTASTDNAYYIEFSFSDNEQFESQSAIAALPKTQPLIQLNGLNQIDVIPNNPTPLILTAGGLMNVKMVCCGTDLFDLFQTELADLNLWRAQNQATGLQIAITSVTPGANNSWDIQLDVTDANYVAAGSGGAINITLGSVSSLNTSGVVGYAGEIETVFRA